MSSHSCITVAQLLQQARQYFPSSTSARLDTELLLIHILQQPRSFLHAHPEFILTHEQYQHWQQLSQRRQQGEPIAYLLKTRGFWSLELQISPLVLIPRPETEQLVELVLQHYQQQSQVRLLDLGTGSGAIALALASERPDWEITATDNSLSALDIAKKNAQHLGIQSVQFMPSHWFQALTGQRFDIIVSNPPYLARHDPHLQQGDLRFEPQAALIAGETGLEAIEHIIHHSSHYLTPSGRLYLEHGYQQASSVRGIFHQYHFQMIKTFQDYSKLDRVTQGSLFI